MFSKATLRGNLTLTLKIRSYLQSSAPTQSFHISVLQQFQTFFEVIGSLIKKQFVFIVKPESLAVKLLLIELSLNHVKPRILGSSFSSTVPCFDRLLLSIFSFDWSTACSIFSIFALPSIVGTHSFSHQNIQIVIVIIQQQKMLPRLRPQLDIYPRNQSTFDHIHQLKLIKKYLQNETINMEKEQRLKRERRVSTSNKENRIGGGNRRLKRGNSMVERPMQNKVVEVKRHREMRLSELYSFDNIVTPTPKSKILQRTYTLFKHRS